MQLRKMTELIDQTKECMLLSDLKDGIRKGMLFFFILLYVNNNQHVTNLLRHKFQNLAVTYGTVPPDLS
jgi:hypothetical protein